MFAVPPLPRCRRIRRTIDFDAAESVASISRTAASLATSTAATHSSITSRSTSTRRYWAGWMGSTRRDGRFPASDRRSAVPSIRRSCCAATFPNGDGAALQRSARCAWHGSGSARNRRRLWRAADPLFEVGGRIRGRQGCRPRRGRTSRQRRSGCRDQVRRRSRRTAGDRIWTACCAESIASASSAAWESVQPSFTCAISGCPASPQARGVSPRGRAARCSRPAFRRIGPEPRSFGPISCRSRIFATHGGPRGCCIMRPSSPASRRRDRFRPMFRLG